MFVNILYFNRKCLYLFTKEFLCDSEPNRLSDQQGIKENASLSLSFVDLLNLEKLRMYYIIYTYEHRINMFITKFILNL